MMECSHHVLSAGIDKRGVSFVYCVECDIEITKAQRENRIYTYCIDTNTWIDEESIKEY